MYKKIIPNTKIRVIPNANRFDCRCTITFINKENTNEWEEEYISALIELPDKYFEIDSISIGHEFIHLLKDISYKEIKNYIFIETLPIFFELLCYENERIMSDEILKYRLINLSKAYSKYKINHEKLILSTWTSDNTSHNLIESYICTTEASYLYSFYNAVILYNQYKINQKRTLELIKKVLEHEITTKSLMNEISLNQNQRNEIFDKEIGILKKVLK